MGVLYWRIFVLKCTRNLSLPFFLAKVCAGFPLFVEEYQKAIDLNEHLIEHPPSTFIIQVMGDSMIEERIYPGDLLVVDRQADVRNGNIVVAVIDGQFCLKKYVRENGTAFLTAANSNFPEFNIGDEQEVEIWGKVVWSLKITSSMAVALVDANNFYVSCQSVFQPKLWGKPVVVLSNNDDCVVARNQPAKDLGIEMGVPAFQIEGLIKAKHVTVFSSNYALYSDMHSRMMELLEGFSPSLERYSIDEAFLDIAEFWGISLEQIARSIKDRLKRCIGIPVSIGIGQTKVLAKVAGYLAKRSKKANGIVSIINPIYKKSALERLPIDEVWGIGRQYSALLKRNGITTALELSEAEDSWIRRNLTVVGLRIVHELRGISCLPLELCPHPKKSITVSRSFGETVTELIDLEAAVSVFVHKAGEKLRKEKMAASALSVFINTSRYGNDPQYLNSATAKLAPLSDLTPELLQAALHILKGIYKPGYMYKKAGVIFLGLTPSETLTRRLWDEESKEKQSRLMEAMDMMNKKFGSSAVKCGLHPSSGQWSTKAATCSPCYTTNIKDILRI